MPDSKRVIILAVHLPNSRFGPHDRPALQLQGFDLGEAIAPQEALKPVAAEDIRRALAQLNEPMQQESGCRHAYPSAS